MPVKNPYPWAFIGGMNDHLILISTGTGVHKGNERLRKLKSHANGLS